jgi:hypothetical protein
MKKSLQVFTLVLLFTAFSLYSYSELLWEKEFTPIHFLKPIVYKKFINCNNSIYLYYNAIDNEAGIISGDRYPCLLKIGENGETIFQTEKRIPIIDSLKNVGILSKYEVRACYCKNNDLLIDIPQTFDWSDLNPNLYLFSGVDGSLKQVKGTLSYDINGVMLWMKHTWEAIISDTEELVLAGKFKNCNQSRIDFHNLIGDSNGYTLKYRIILNMDKFRDSVLTDNYAKYFLQVDDTSFVVKYPPKKKGNTILAKYSYNKSLAYKLPSWDTMSSKLMWHTIYRTNTEPSEGLAKYILLENGNILGLHLNKCLVILDKDGKVIFNKVIFTDEKYKNYMITNMMPLKYKPGYYAFWGMDKIKSNNVILITDSNWNVVDDIVWNFGNTSNLLWDVTEKVNGNLLLLGEHTHNDGGTYYYVTDYAEVRPNYTGVKDQSVNEQIEISPNPAYDFITIKLGAINPTLKRGVDEIKIYNTLGEKVMAESIHPMTASHRMNIENLPKGIYFVKVGGETAKFVKI